MGIFQSIRARWPQLSRRAKAITIGIVTIVATVLGVLGVGLLQIYNNYRESQETGLT